MNECHTLTIETDNATRAAVLYVRSGFLSIYFHAYGDFADTCADLDARTARTGVPASAYAAAAVSGELCRIEGATLAGLIHAIDSGATPQFVRRLF